MSKTFAGAAATLLVEQDLQNWETRISDLFPDLRLGNGVSYRSITLKQVASHSTGLMPHSYSNLLDDGIGYERIKNRFADIPAVCKPGRCYGYQNVIFPSSEMSWKKVPAPVTGNTSKSRYFDP